MKRVTLLLVSLALVAATSGCNIYFGGGDDDDDDDSYGDDDDDDCAWGGGDGSGAEEPAISAAIILRDPYTGQCVEVGWGGGGGGCDQCGNCYPGPPEVPPPPWGSCDNYCAGLDEGSCLETSGCRGGYLEYCVDGTMCDLTQAKSFYECWAVDQTGPFQGSCDGLDAWSCSQHDDCIAIHDNTCNGTRNDPPPPPGEGEDPAPDFACGLGNFLQCAAEVDIDPPPNCQSDADCDLGSHCEYPDADSCTMPGDDGGMGDGFGAPKPCWGTCIPTYDPGSCYSVVLCDSTPPTCPDGEVPGIANECWSGVCIPLDQCEDAPCNWLGEEECVERTDCEAFYQGINCTCDEDGTCTCNDWVFTVCLAENDPPPPQSGPDEAPAP